MWSALIKEACMTHSCMSLKLLSSQLLRFKDQLDDGVFFFQNLITFLIVSIHVLAESIFLNKFVANVYPGRSINFVVKDFQESLKQLKCYGLHVITLSIG